MKGYEWPVDGVRMRMAKVEICTDGEWWAEFRDVEHGEIFLEIKLVERPSDDAEWLLRLYDPLAETEDTQP